MRRIILLSMLLLLALPAQASAATAADCRFDDSKSYAQFGRIHVFTMHSDLYGCVTDVGRAYRLNATSPSRAFGMGDWVGVPTRGGKVQAVNLRTGQSHSTPAKSKVTALVVNLDGTLTWIANGELRTKPRKGDARRLATGADAGFLGLENDGGCAVTWKARGVQRSSSIYCRAP